MTCSIVCENDKNEFRIYFAKQIDIFREIRREVSVMKYLNISEAAVRWGITGRRIQQLCKSGAIKGAKKEGRSWLLPETAGIPLHSRSEKRPKLLPLPVGISGYVEAVTKYYYIDIGITFRGKEVVVKQADK